MDLGFLKSASKKIKILFIVKKHYLISVFIDSDSVFFVKMCTTTKTRLITQI